MKIGFIGTGIMGSAIVLNLMPKHQLYVYTRTKSKADHLIEKGAVWCDTPRQLLDQVDLVMTMVGYPSDVEAVYFDAENGLLNHGKAGLTLIDLTTSTPALAIKIHQAAMKRGISVLDAPVSGGDTGAKNSTLTIMVGGEKETFDKMVPIFDLIGNNVVYQGPAGSGQHTKMCNQICIATNLLGVCEALTYAKTVGLDPKTVLASIETGSAASTTLSKFAPMIIENDMSVTFYLKHFIKDLKIALDEAIKAKLDLPNLALAVKFYNQLFEQYQDAGIQALINAYPYYEK